MSFVKVQDAIELICQRCGKVVADSLGFGTVDHTDGTFQPLGMDDSQTYGPIAPRQ